MSHHDDAGIDTTPRSTLVQVISPQPLVVRGLVEVLDELGGSVSVESGAIRRAQVPDVVVYDVIGLLDDGGATLDAALAVPGVGVLVLGRELRPELELRAMARGAHLGVPLGATTVELLSGVRLLASGWRGSGLAVAPTLRESLARQAGLTPREFDVLTRITAMSGNREIADDLYLSINSVKTYIRSAYRKLGVSTRSQAITWCLMNGFEPGALDEVGPPIARDDILVPRRAVDRRGRLGPARDPAVTKRRAG